MLECTTLFFFLVLSCFESKVDFSYDELVREHKVDYVAGGAAQNAARGAAVS